MHFTQQNKKKMRENAHRTQENAFFEICFDEISYNTPYLQVCTKKKKCLNIFFLREISSAAPTTNGKGRGGRSHLHDIILHPLLEVVVGGVVVVKET